MKKKTRKKLLQILFFLIKLNLLALPLYILISLDFSYPPLQKFVALLSYKILSIFGIQASLNETTLKTVMDFKITFVEIDMDCTGWKSLYTLSALAFATPGIKLKRKGIFLVFSLPTLFLFNIARIVVTIYSSLINPEIFALVHDILWSWGLVIAILGIWLIWLKFEKRI